MLLGRRGFLLAGAALGTSAWLRAAPKEHAGGRRVVIVGGGWGGLAAARHLRDYAPELDVTLLERNPQFRSCPLSNQWLVDRIDISFLVHDYRTASRHWGYRFVQTEVDAIDREKREVTTSAGTFPYDWLVLAIGIRHDYSAWFGDDRETADHARNHYPSAFTAGDELSRLKEMLDRFRGGTLLMTLPPQPCRCPPAPLERAALLAGWFAARQIPVRILILDPNPPIFGFQQLFAERHAKAIDYHYQTRIVAVDPRRRRVSTDFETFDFDAAILMPPQQAGDLAWQAGLIGRSADGLPSAWAAADPLSFLSNSDHRIYVVGDMLDRVSPLFGHYTKGGQMASRQGRIVARQIAARARSEHPRREFPDSVCHIATQYDPPEALRIEASFRLRGDGVLLQQIRSERDPQPRGEELAWARNLFADFITPSAMAP